KSVANARSTGSVQARNGTTVPKTVYAGSWSNVTGTVTNLRCRLRGASQPKPAPIPPPAKHWIATEWGSPDSWEFVEESLPAPTAGEITIRVRAAGVNPADAKHVAAARPGLVLPIPIGYEVSGEISAIGPDTRIGSGEAAIGD